MKKILLVILIITSVGVTSHAQTLTEKRWVHSVGAGLNLGALSPIPLPNNIRKVKSYSPLISPDVYYGILYRLNDHWSLGARGGLSIKGMNVKDSVLYFHTLVQVGDGAQASSFEGAFTGTNETRARNYYLNFPVYIEFTPRARWHYNLGVYAAFLVKRKFEGTVSDGYIRNGGSLGEKVEITSASFDFAKKQRSFDYGLTGGASFSASKDWRINANLQWGLRRVFPSSFTGISFGMYNIFANFGVAYQLN